MRGKELIGDEGGLARFNRQMTEITCTGHGDYSNLKNVAVAW